MKPDLIYYLLSCTEASQRKKRVFAAESQNVVFIFVTTLLTTVKKIQNIDRNHSLGEICDPSSLLVENRLEESGWLELFSFVRAEIKPTAKGKELQPQTSIYITYIM